MIIRIEDAEKHDGKEATVQGWMYNKRGSGENKQGEEKGRFYSPV